jgi:Effector Associated Constant Component 1
MVTSVSIRPTVADHGPGDSAWIDSVNALYEDLHAARGELRRDTTDAFPAGSKGIPETVYIVVTLGSMHEICGVIKEWLRRQGRTVTVTVRNERGEQVIILDGSAPDKAIVEALRHAVRSRPDE